MRLAFLLAAILAASPSAMADAIKITSPDHAQTFAYGEMISHQLYLNRTEGELVVQIAFSNQPCADCNDPPTNESFDFRFPGVQFDSARRVFVATSGHGELIPVARFGKDLVCGWVDLSPGAKIYLVKDSGRVTATLTATNYPRAGTRWVQTDNNFSLQNILIALFGEFFPASEN
jgi:hypothetical protein